MTNEKILTLGEKEFKTYIRTERSKAIEKTLKIQNDLETSKDENKILIFEQSIVRLGRNEGSRIVNRERFDELRNLVRTYYGRKIKINKNEFNTKLQTLIPIVNEGDRLQEEMSLVDIRLAIEQASIQVPKMLSVDEKNALDILMSIGK